MNKKLGFIGCGNMAKAIIAGVIETNTLQADEICIYDLDSGKTSEIAQTIAIDVAMNIPELCQKSDIILLAIKPNVISKVVQENREYLSDKAVISIAAGITSEQLQKWSTEKTRVLRVMPNTPAMVGQGATALSLDSNFTEKEKVFAETIFGAMGIALWVPEHLMDAVVGVSGSGPAYAFLFIEAMADGGVNAGLPRDIALKLAAQTLAGSAQMLLQSEKHPGELKDMVCSPAGTTIEAVQSLEEDGFRGAIMKAVNVAAQKSREMAKE